jgi:hypothetical protein
MNSKFSMKSMVAIAALMAGISGLAHADDSSMNPFTGGSYAYFNGGNLPGGDKPVFDTAPSTWRQAHPTGLPEQTLESLSSEHFASDFQRAAFDKAPSTWRETHPNGLSEREMQALSSESAVWHQQGQFGTSSFVTTRIAGTTNPAVR